MKIGNFLIAKFQTLVVITIHDTVTRRTFIVYPQVNIVNVISTLNAN